MPNHDLIDPELARILGDAPAMETTAETLGAMRAMLAGLRIPAPDAPDVHVDVRRCTIAVDGRSVDVVVYRPRTGAPSGALLWIHGGGLVMGVPEMNDAQNRYLAASARCVIVAVAYRLAPEHPYPAGLDDCTVALGWMHDRASAWGVRRERIAVAGESAGGALAVGLALRARDGVANDVVAQFLLYPMLDDRTGTSDDLDPMPYAGTAVWTRASNAFAWTAALGARRGAGDAPSAYASPGRATSVAGLPRTAIVIGDTDLFIGENLRFARRLIAAGVPTELHVFAGATHGFTSFGGEAAIAGRGRAAFWGEIVRYFGA